jgi:glycosyltransferase involved in cell wall biosynthesis
MARPILILSEPTVPSYGTIGTLYRETFRAMGLPCTLRHYPTTGAVTAPSGAIVLHNTLGFRLAPARNAVNIAVPFHEWDRYPAAWASRLNAFDEVWASSEALAAVLRRSGVTAHIRFAPPAIDLIPPRRKVAWSPHKSFRFLFVGEPHFRKGHHLLMEGFRRLGVSDGRATLTIKTSPDCPWRVDDRRVQVIAERWPTSRLRDLYARHDAFVSASLGEGLGLGIAEAALARLPIAANYWGGHTSLLTPGAYVRIPHRVVPQPYCSRPEFYAPGQRCALSTPDAIAAAMRALMRMSAAARERQAARAAAYVEQRYGFGAASARIQKALSQL